MQEKIKHLRSKLGNPEKIAIIGAERSGLAVAKIAKQLGIEVWVSDHAKKEKQEALKKKLDEYNISYELGEHSNRIFENTDLIVVSPGVPKNAPILQKALAKNLPIWSELEFAFRLWEGKLIAITGSVAKSTITTWIGEVMKQAKVPHIVAGNIGIPFSEFVLEESQEKWAVIEVSSFQLEWIETFLPTIAVVTNLIPNHLDRYENVNEYYLMKTGITKNQSSQDWLILNKDNQLIPKYFSQFNRNLFPYSAQHPLERGVWLGTDRIMLRDTELLPTKLTEFKQIQLIGRHNLSNACAVVAACYAAKIPFEAIHQGLIHFKGIPHRLQKIESADGRIWYNDSKATTPESAKVALTSFSTTVVWLAGGYNKGIDLAGLRKIAEKKVKCLIAFGDAAEKIELEYGDVVKVIRVGTLKQAVEKAFQITKKGDTILLSPMCASFDEFRDFEDRGEKFEAYIKEMQC